MKKIPKCIGFEKTDIQFVSKLDPTGKGKFTIGLQYLIENAKKEMQKKEKSKK